ncbi:MAG: type II toxin-antitoxin system RelE/ParE family toxin [Rhodoferax sp.]|nr:type II toxin-antitoxin system RelE/ParE family toxin [Rhodoferax sp.]
MKRLRVKRCAMRDLAQARAYYRRQAPPVVADFALAIDAELLDLRRNPAKGSPRYGLQIGFAGLRSWTVKMFPYAIFYVPQTDCVVVIRVLHQAADIPTHLGQ